MNLAATSPSRFIAVLWQFYCTRAKVIFNSTILVSCDLFGPRTKLVRIQWNVYWWRCVVDFS